MFDIPTPSKPYHDDDDHYIMLHAFAEREYVDRATGKVMTELEHVDDRESGDIAGWNVWVRRMPQHDDVGDWSDIDEFDRDFETEAEARAYAQALLEVIPRSEIDDY